MAYALVTPLAACSPPDTEYALLETGCAFCWTDLAGFRGVLAIWFAAGRLIVADRGAAGFFGTPFACGAF